jgi:hypothetical protein
MEEMMIIDLLYVILVLAVLFGIGYIIAKVQGSVNIAASKKSMLFLNPLAFETSAPVQVIMRQIEAHVITASGSSPYNAVVYRSSQTADQIAYAYGNKFEPKMFEAVLLCKSSGTRTKCVLRVPRWRAENGIIIGQNFLAKLRIQVREAFAAADPAVRVTETPAGGR